MTSHDGATSDEIAFGPPPGEIWRLVDWPAASRRIARDLQGMRKLAAERGFTDGWRIAEVRLVIERA
jgi:hypothetical protein